MVGQAFGEYRIVRELGRGRAGVVYLAQGPRNGKAVAVKVPVAQEGEDARVRLDRFLADAQSASALGHPGIATVLAQGVAAGQAYLVTEHLEGSTLRGWLTAHPSAELGQRLTIARKVAAALAAAHDRRIVHGAVRPENVFLVGDDPEAVKLTDFGLGRILGGATAAALAYASPERCRRPERTDLYDDLYAFGCMLYEMVCGRLPFPYTDRDALVAAHLGEPPTPPTALNPALPAGLDRVVLAALCKSAGGRPRNLRTVEESLERVAAGGPEPAGESPWPPARDENVVPRLTPLGHVHLRPRDLRIGGPIASETPARRTPLGQAHRGQGGEPPPPSVPARAAAAHPAVVPPPVLTPAPAVDAAVAAVEEPEPTLPMALPARPRGRRLWWVLGVLAVLAAAAGLFRGLRSHHLEAETPPGAPAPLTR
jgi:serine/threonine protein kinase